LGKYRKFIKKGVIEPLERVPYHKKAPIKRLSLLDKSINPESTTHVAVHFVDVSGKMTEYSELHIHDHDEINLILSEDSKLCYQVQLGDETYKVSSNSSIFIPKGLPHSAQAVSGKGIFVCIILASKYSSKAKKTL
jgi:quercetin dioxygenase-like cupin family protein